MQQLKNNKEAVGREIIAADKDSKYSFNLKTSIMGRFRAAVLWAGGKEIEARKDKLSLQDSLWVWWHCGWNM